MKCARPACTRNRHHHAPFCTRHYDSFRQEREARGGRKCGRVPASVAVEHLDRLSESGLGVKRVGDLTGITYQSLQRIRNSNRKFVFADTAHRILSVPVPPNPHVLAAAGRCIPLLGTQRRVQALACLGYTNQMIGERVGVTHAMVSLWALGKQRFIHADKARAVDAMFRELQLTKPLETYGGKRAALRAARRGWHPPLAWDEETIDDPGAEPQLPESGQYDWVEDYEYLRESGLDDDAIAARWGMKRSSLAQRLCRYRQGR